MTPVSSGSPYYALLMLAGMAIGAVYWIRAAKTDSRLPIIYFCGLVSALFGAKFSFLLAEGWLHTHDPNRWQIWLSGKSVMGALPGGWIGVEVAKRMLGYTRITGDRFAMLLPVPLILGRIGCLSAGCCGGVICSFGPWPAVPVEMAFQCAAMVSLFIMRRRNWQSGQHFHLYLIGYGLFRFAHEFLRATPKPFLGLSGYQLIALVTAFAAILAYQYRSRENLRRA